ncbi:MAG: class I SAM-dependent methyltransferase [Chloroflexi bacterium]|nr:class I SAM-dependent methyltransferase [Chloroflexota bacterium]
MTSRNFQNYANSNIDQILFGNHIREWQMSTVERCTLIQLVEKIKPECAIEIGTAQGGSLSAIAKLSNKVYTLDIDPSCQERLGPQFSNVEFITGKSQQTLPPLIRNLQENGTRLEFVLIDGKHSRNAVKQDIEAVLTFRPNQPLYILMHDSFNPGCRQGIIEANWAANPHVHFVQLDFVTGTILSTADFYRQMWGGFALALLLPFERTGELTIQKKQEMLFQSVLPHSIHNRITSIPARIMSMLYRRARQYLGRAKSF